MQKPHKNRAKPGGTNLGLSMDFEVALTTSVLRLDTGLGDLL